MTKTAEKLIADMDDFLNSKEDTKSKIDAYWAGSVSTSVFKSYKDAKIVKC